MIAHWGLLVDHSYYPALVKLQGNIVQSSATEREQIFPRTLINFLGLKCTIL